VSTKKPILQVLLYDAIGDESDEVLEIYGSFRYQVDGGEWITLASASDDDTWNLIVQSGHQHKVRGAPSQTVYRHYLTLPSSAQTIRLQASLREYDPSIFDSDEDWGTEYCSLSVATKGQPFRDVKQGCGRDSVIWRAEILQWSPYSEFTEATEASGPVEWEFVPHKDSGGHDVGQMGRGKSIDEMKALAASMPECVAFNSNGWFKRSLRPENEWSRWTSDSSKGFYIKRRK